MSQATVTQQVPATAAVADACIREKVPFRMADPSIRCMFPAAPLCGPALPVKHTGSVDVFLEAYNGAAANSILVIDNEGRHDEGCIGDLTAIEGKQAGVQAAVIWGRHRDTAEIRRLQFPVFSLGSHSVGPNRTTVQRGTVGVANLAGVTVTPQDWVFADEDGILFIDKDQSDKIVASALALTLREREQADAVPRGQTLRQQFRFNEYLEKRSRDPNYTLRKHLRVLGGEVEV